MKYIFFLLLILLPQTVLADTFYFILKSPSIYVVHPVSVKRMELKLLEIKKEKHIFKIKADSKKTDKYEVLEDILDVNEGSLIYLISKEDYDNKN